ncbi:MAG: alpha/beta fold hydrolase [Candidatus Wallbacteria bacterium]|nr:alpha/beta fold hydrolase [Candidatus Wallbacteria bacterium]
MDPKEKNLEAHLDQCFLAGKGLLEHIAKWKIDNLSEIKDCCTKSAGNDPHTGTGLLYETPNSTIYREGTFRLLKYNPNPRLSTPLLIVPSLINRYYILDLMQGNSLIEYLTQAGFSVYLLDWGIPGREQDHLSFEHYINKWIRRAVTQVLRDSGEPSCALLGYCMGGTMAACYAAADQKRINALISLAAPYDFSGDDPLSLLARNMDLDKLVDSRGYIPAELLQAGFLMAQPLSPLQKARSLYDNNDDARKNDVFLHLERWLSDNVPFPKEAYRQYIREFYRENNLISGKFSLNGRKIKLSDIKAPVLSVIATRDSIVPAKASLALNEAVSGTAETIEIDAGHIGIVMGRKAKEAWMGMTMWLTKAWEKGSRYNPG